ncbi:MAG TPA: ABC-2 family transporter protein [Candidatus Baltobacteraceae bacterium]|nr:ABC-2 family transporter protein [Candidatus Baltobacteraceae bacterium]
MQLEIGRYLAHFRVNQRAIYYYKMDMALNVMFTVLGFAIMIAVWTAVYLTTGATQINGLTLVQIYAYFIAIGALQFIIGTNIDDQLTAAIQDGSIATAMLKPIKYPLQLLLGTLADYVSYYNIPALLFLGIAALLAHSSLGAWTIAAFVVEIVIAFALVNLVGFLLGLAAIYLTNIYGLMSIVFTVIGILGGTVAPLVFYPQWAQSIIYLTPFPSMYYIPAATFLGTVGSGTILQGIAIGALWIVALLGCSAVAWRKLSVKVALAGG